MDDPIRPNAAVCCGSFYGTEIMPFLAHILWVAALVVAIFFGLDTNHRFSQSISYWSVSLGLGETIASSWPTFDERLRIGSMA